MEQSAVEWLVEQIFNEVDLKDSILKLAVKQAKEIEKEQIKDAHLIGLITSMEMEATKQAEEYYNETYKSE